MALTYSEMVPLGSKAPAFTLQGTRDGHTETTVSLRDFDGSRALLVMFICNHCPYVQAINARLAALAAEYTTRGVGFAAVCSNDAVRYPGDSFDNLKAQHREFGFNFPYLVDETQAVARAYGAVCTPDFFLFDGEQKLAYRGRMDDNWKEPRAVKTRDLAAALDALLGGRAVSPDQVPSMGCSIKWKV
jgi:peroxiredoxin